MTESGRVAAKQKRKVYVGNLPSTMDEERLREHFEQYGKIHEVHVLNRIGRGGRLSSFVTFSDARAALGAINSQQEWHPDGQIHKVTIKFADVKGIPAMEDEEAPLAPPYKLYVSNLPRDSTTSYIREIFEGCGKVTDCYLLSSRGRGGRRSSFITFETRQAACDALTQLGDQIFDDNQRLTVRWANPPKPHTEGAGEDEPSDSDEDDSYIMTRASGFNSITPSAPSTVLPNMPQNPMIGFSNSHIFVPMQFPFQTGLPQSAGSPSAQPVYSMAGVQPQGLPTSLLNTFSQLHIQPLGAATQAMHGMFPPFMTVPVPKAQLEK